MWRCKCTIDGEGGILPILVTCHLPALGIVTRASPPDLLGLCWYDCKDPYKWARGGRSVLWLHTGGHEKHHDLLLVQGTIFIVISPDDYVDTSRLFNVM